tara:strand:+ start:700 stop:2277 length:1578 start_codon:yes stop_codon:yes gene_type:complete
MNIYDSYLFNLIKYNPTLNDYINIKYFNSFKNIQPNIFTNNYINNLNKLDKKYIGYLKNIKNKDKYTEIFEYDLTKSKIKINYDLLCMNLIDNIFFEYISNSTGENLYSFNNIKDYENYIERLKKLNSITNSIINLLKDGIKKNIKHDKLIIFTIINYFKDALNNKTYEHKKKIPQKIKKKYENAIQKYLVKNLSKILLFLENNYFKYLNNNLGLSFLKNGKNDYLIFLKNNTYKSITPKKVINIANIELKKCLSELTKIKNKLKFKGSIKDLHKNIVENKKYIYDTNSEILDDLNKIKIKINKTIVKKYFYNENINLDYDIKIMNKANYGISIYYQPPINNKKGIFYLKNKSILNKNELYVLSLHEGNPGHNYEYLLNIKKNIPKYVLTNYYSGFSEGWAMYTESLLESKNLYEVFFQHIYNLFRIIRLYLDTGINYYGWSYDKCSEFIKKYVYVTDDFIKEEIIRYVSNPAQAISYKIGELLIQKYKKIYLKKNNNIKDFHKLVLDIGPCPLDIFIKEMNKNM